MVAIKIENEDEADYLQDQEDQKRMVAVNKLDQATH